MTFENQDAGVCEHVSVPNVLGGSQDLPFQLTNEQLDDDLGEVRKQQSFHQDAWSLVRVGDAADRTAAL